MFKTKVVEKIKMHVIYPLRFFRKFYRLEDNVENYGTTEETTCENVMWLMRFVCWITKAKNTLTTFTPYCFSTVKIVTRTCLNIAFILVLPVLSCMSIQGGLLGDKNDLVRKLVGSIPP